MRAAISALLIAASLLAAPVSNAAAPAAPHVTVGAGTKQLLFDWSNASGAAYYRLMYRVNSNPWKPLINNIPASTTHATVSLAVHLQGWTQLRYAVAACNSSGCTNSAEVFPQNLMLDAIGYFKASNTEADDQFGRTVALSDDGRTLAVTAAWESSNAAGVNGNQADNSSPYSGAVYVFRRGSNGWRQEAWLKAGVNQPGQYFGSGLFVERETLAFNADGSLLAIGTPDQDTGGTLSSGSVFVYQRSPAGSWGLAATLDSPEPSPYARFGFSVDMSLDGRTLKVDAFATWDAVDGNPRFRTYVFVRPGATWQHSATLAGMQEDDYCQWTRMSRDGNTLVAVCENFFGPPHLVTFKRSGNTWTNVSAQEMEWGGVRLGMALNYDASTLALQESHFQQPEQMGVYRWTGAAWSREALVTVSAYNPLGNELRNIVVLNRAGDLMAIGDRSVAEDGAGVSPGSHPGEVNAGAVYLYKRDAASGTWTRRAVIKAPNPDEWDFFGSSLAMCGTGHALVVGAEGEASSARGVDGDRTDNSSPNAGAVYLY